MTFNLSGRNKQRERANSETSIQKSTSDTNTMRSHHLLQVDEELSMARSTYDLKIIEMLIKSANTDEKKVLDALYFWTKVKSIFFWMPCFGRVIRNVSSQKLSKSTVLDNFFGHGKERPYTFLKEGVYIICDVIW